MAHPQPEEPQGPVTPDYDGLDVAGLLGLWSKHADAIRGLLFRCLLAIVVVAFGLFEISPRFMAWLEAPLLRAIPGAKNIYYTGIADKFVVYLKVTLLVSVLVTAPYWLWEICRAGARIAGRTIGAVWFYPFAALIALYTGMAFGYFVLLPVGLEYLLGFASPTEQAFITLTRYYRFVLQTLSAASVLFEVPVVILFLGKLGLVHADFLSERRRWMIFLSTLFAFVLAPSPDSLSFLAVLGPLYLLFELSIQCLRWTERRRR